MTLDDHRHQPSVVLVNAAVRIARQNVWSEVNLTVGHGEFVAILGPNGTGKSTLVKAILGLHPLAQGSASVLGAPPGVAARRIGYLPQRRSFDPGLPVRGADIVRFGYDGDRWGFPLGLGKMSRARREAREKIEWAIEMVGAGSYAHRPIGQVSGGEQQRLLIAQALVRDPDLLLLDEPLDSLDLPNQGSVAALLSDICRKQGMTVMLVAHDVNPILGFLDRVVYLARGRVISGTPGEVITAETLSRLYDTRIDVFTTSEGRLCVVGQPDAPAPHPGHDHHGGRN